jgi:hypothetical protein
MAGRPPAEPAPVFRTATGLPGPMKENCRKEKINENQCELGN